MALRGPVPLRGGLVSVERDRVQPALVLTHVSVGGVGADQDDLTVMRRAVVGLEHQVEVALARLARKAVRVSDLHRLRREDEDAVVVALRPFLVAADGMGLGDHLRVLPAGGPAPVREDNPRVLARAEAVAASDAPRPGYDAGGCDLHLRGCAEAVVP